MVTALVVPVVAFAMVAAATVAVFVAAMMLLGREELAVQPLFELLLRGLAHLFHNPLKMQGFSGHGMVEIHGHHILFHLTDQSLNHLAGRIQHGNPPPGNQKFLHQPAIHHKGRFAQVDAFVGLVGAITFLGGKGKGKGLRGLQALQFLLKLGQQHVGAVNIIQVVMLDRLAVDGKFVMQENDFILIDFHDVMN